MHTHKNMLMTAGPLFTLRSGGMTVPVATRSWRKSEHPSDEIGVDSKHGHPIQSRLSREPQTQAGYVRQSAALRLLHLPFHCLRRLRSPARNCSSRPDDQVRATVPRQGKNYCLLHSSSCSFRPPDSPEITDCMSTSSLLCVCWPLPSSRGSTG